MSDINKFTYSTDTLTTLSNKMPHSRDSMGAAGNYSSKGYLMGGVNSVSGTYYSNTQKVTYSTDTGGNAPTASSYTAMIDIGAGSDYAKNYAYFVGGATGATYLSASFPNGSYSLPFPNTVSTIQKVAYSTDTRTTLSQKLSSAPLYGSGTLETQYNECFGTSVVPGDRKGVGVAPGKNFLFIHGGGSYDSCTYSGFVRTFEWHWSEIELMSYATDTMIYLHTNFTSPSYNEKASHTALAAI